MTTQNLRLKLTRVNSLKLKMLPRYPVNFEVGNFLTLTKVNGVFTFGVDYTLLGPGPITDQTTAMIVVLDETAGTYKLVSLSSLLSSSTKQVKTGTGNVTMATSDSIVAINKTVGAATTVTVPLSSSKVGGCLVTDFKGDAGTNNITINLTSPDTFPGGGATWTITGNGGSVFLRPISGLGYAI